MGKRQSEKNGDTAAERLEQLMAENARLTRQNQSLQHLIDDMPGGYYRHDNSEEYEFLYVSQRFQDLVGYTESEIRSLFQNKLSNMIHPEDRELVRQGLIGLEQTGGNCSLPYRIHTKSGYISVYDQGRLVECDGQEVFQGLIICDMDYYHRVHDLENDNDAESVHRSSLMPCGIFQAEADGGHEFSYISNSMLAMLGYTRTAFQKKFKNSTNHMIWKDDLARISREVDEQIEHGNDISLEYRIEMVDGSLRWVYSRGRLTIDAQGKRWFYVCITDYDYLKEKYREKEWQQMKYKSLSEIPGTIVYDYDPFRDQFTMEVAVGEGEVETIVTEKFLEEMEHHPWLSGEKIEEQRSTLQAASILPMSGNTEFKSRFRWDREYHWYRSYFTSLVDEDGIVYRIVGRADNIDDEKNIISDLRDRSRKDSMTNLLNNQSARETLGEAIQEFHGGMLFLLDINEFREINASLGHVEADAILKNVAKIVRTTFQKQDIQSRFGADVFLVFMPGIFDREVAALKAQELLRRTEEIDLTDGRKVRCSIGIATAENRSCGVDNLIHQADLALYEAKRDRESGYVFFAS